MNIYTQQSLFKRMVYVRQQRYPYPLTSVLPGMSVVLLSIVLLAATLTAHAATPQRVVSISSAVTEIIYDLGKQDTLVANDTTSYYPAAAAQLPKVGYMRALSAEGILSLSPDLVILTNESGPPTVLHQLSNAGVELLVLQERHTIASIVDKIARIAAALGVPAKGNALIHRIHQQHAALKKSVANTDNMPKVLFIMQNSAIPLVAGSNTAADSIIRLSGATNSVATFSGYKPLTPEAAIVYAPDILLFTTRGLTQAGGRQGVLNIPGLALTPAGKNKRIIAMDSMLMLGFGPRTAAAATQLLSAYATP